MGPGGEHGAIGVVVEVVMVFRAFVLIGVSGVLAGCNVESVAGEGGRGDSVEGIGGVKSTGVGSTSAAAPSGTLCFDEGCVATDGITHGCGDFVDACGAERNCGPCPGNAVCGADNTCGEAGTTASSGAGGGTCFSEGCVAGDGVTQGCGDFVDACGAERRCGPCPPNAECSADHTCIETGATSTGAGGGGGLCFDAACVSEDGTAHGCGFFVDACGAELACGACPSGIVCGDDHTCQF